MEKQKEIEIRLRRVIRYVDRIDNPDIREMIVSELIKTQALVADLPSPECCTDRSAPTA